MLLRRLLPVFLIGFFVVGSSGGVLAQVGGPDNPAAPADLAGTGFTYQGELANGGNLVTGTCDFQFALWDSLSGGSQVGATETVAAVSVINGRFTVMLNSGGLFGPRAFDGGARWLAISVRCPAGSGGYAPLNPRQPLTPAPYALALPGLRTEQNPTSPNVIGGSISNTVTGGTFGATIAGGGSPGVLNLNTVTANFGTVSGGHSNTASGPGATVGGGSTNTASKQFATVGGGDSNVASGLGSFIGGGGYDGPNTSGNTAAGAASTIGGGLGNGVTTSATYGTVGGGIGNLASGAGATIDGGGYDGSNVIGNTAAGPASTIGGGIQNTASKLYATVGGGGGNQASGIAGTVPGGFSNNAAGDYSFAAGDGSSALHNGAFVWTCKLCPGTSSGAADQFVANAAGGFWFGGRGSGSTTGPGGGIGASLFISTSTGGYLSTAGVWVDVSDRNAKTNFAPLAGSQVLDALMGLPIDSWSYKVDAAGARHIGPTAQDFYAAFNVGNDDTHLAALDTSGVALAAIQSLYSVVQQKDAQIAAQQAEITTLQTGQAKTDARLAALETQAAQAGQPAPAPSQLPQALPWLLLGGLILLNVGGLAGYVLAGRLRTRP